MAIAPHSHHLSPFLILLLAVHILLSFSSTTTTATTTSFSVNVIINLVHVDAHLNLTFQERIHRVIHRSHQRVMNLLPHGRRGRRHHASSIETPMQAGHGEFLMRLSLGTPPTSFLAIIDTASDLVWTQCNPCTLCFNQTSPIFDPQRSSSYSKLLCSNPSCNSLTHFCEPLSNYCLYSYVYGDHSSTDGYLSSETFTLGSMSFKNIGFGCGSLNQGFLEGAGLVGLNRGRLSLISQIGPLVGHRFSYCLSGLDGRTAGSSRLVFGHSASMASSKARAMTLPLLINPRNPDYYFVALEGISVGGKRLPIPISAFQFNQHGTGGVFVDSGSAFTYLVPEAYRQVREEFVTAIGLPVEQAPGVDLCFRGLLSSSSIPSLTLHFSGGDLCPPQENYLITDVKDHISCLAISQSPMGMSVIGAFMQQNVHIQYDLGNNLITLIPTQCDRL